MPSSGSTTIQVRRNLDGKPPSLTATIEISQGAVRLRETQLGARVLLDGWPRTGKIGGPGLPSRAIWIALPDGMAVKGAIAVRVGREVALTRGATAIAPLRPPVRDAPDRTRSSVPSVARDAALYQADERARRPTARLAGTERLGGTRIAVVDVNPVSVGPHGDLLLASEIELTLPLAAARDVSWSQDVAGGVAPVSRAQFERLHHLARAAVVNPADVSPPQAPAATARETRWDYVIVTDDTTWNAKTKSPVARVKPSLVAAFQALADWKCGVGLRTRVVKVAEIVQSRTGAGLGHDFTTGAADLQEAIRRFVRWAHDTWGTAYVLLGGDDRIVPIRRLAMGNDTPKSMPTDLYYAALHPQNDAEWKEGSAPAYGSHDFARLVPNVSVGRAPASNGTEAGIFLAKVKAYEGLRTSGNGLAQPWLERFLYVSSKWGGDVPTEIEQAPQFPPGDDHYAIAPGGARAVVKLRDTVRVTQDPSATTESPSFDCFNQAPGKPYVKIHLRPTYKAPLDIVANLASGTVTLAHDEKASVTKAGFYYTDWLDKDGPSHDGQGKNAPTDWIIVFLPGGAAPRTFDVRLTAALRLDYNLLAKVGPGDYRPVPFDLRAATSKHGWYFARSATDPTPNPVDGAGHQIATPWIAVFAPASELTPKAFVMDPTEEADTMREQEELRRQVERDIPCWDAESALYPDVADLPPADRAGVELQYYTQDRLRAKLDAGQHVVSLGGHGNPYFFAGAEGGDFDCALADRLVNGARCGIVYGNSCRTNRYTEDGLSRHLVMKNAGGGAVAYVGFLDNISIALGHFVENRFFADLARTGVLGLAFDARAAMVLPGSGFNDDAELHYTIMMASLLGDPALRVHGAEREYLLASAVAAARETSGRLVAVYLRPDHGIAAVKQDPGGWTRAAVIDRGSWASATALGVNGDGRVEVVYIGSDGKLYHLWQEQPNGRWSPSFVLDNGSSARELAVGSNKDGRLEVVYIGSDHKLYHVWQETPGGAWTPSFVLDNGSYAKQLRVASNGDGRLEVVYVGSDDKLYHVWQETPGGAWTTSSVLDNGSFAKQLELGVNRDGRLEVFYIGSDDRLYHIWQDTPGGGWTPSFVLDAGSAARQLRVASNRDGRLEVVYAGSDHKLYHVWQETPGGAWTPSCVLDKGSYAKQLCVASNADGRLEVLYVGSDDRLYHLWQTSAGGAWSASTPLLG